MAQDFVPFRIDIRERTSSGFLVVADFEGLRKEGLFPANFPPFHLDDTANQTSGGFLETDAAKSYGYRLFRTLFAGEVLEGFRTAYERVASQEKGLRVILSVPAEIAHLPWELMYDRRGGLGYLARSTKTPLVRHLALADLPHKIPTNGPLRVLVISASPLTRPPVSHADEIDSIRQAFRKGSGILATLRLLAEHLRRNLPLKDFINQIRSRRAVEIEILSNATQREFQGRIAAAESEGRGYHVAHFIGHGFSSQAGSYLVFETENGSGEDLVSAEEFAEILSDTSINLAVLNACHSAAGVDPSGIAFFHSTAAATARTGVRAVIGMQVEILDRSAASFAREFYTAWAAGHPIELALSYARRLFQDQSPMQAANWSIPVLYMGPAGGLKIQLDLRQIALPLWLRAIRLGFWSLIGLIGVVTALLSIPDINRQLRTEAPLIPCVWPYPLEKSNELIVVVTQFSAVNARGWPVWNSSDAQELAIFLFRDLDSKRNQYQGLTLVPYQHNCPIRARTAADRENKAAGLADKLNADFVIYGEVRLPDQDQLRFSPEFYVKEPGILEAPELTGQFQLGDEIRLLRPFDADVLPANINPALSARTQALSLITIGLSYYQQDLLVAAEQAFSDALKIPNWGEDTNAGTEVAYLLLGNVNVRQASMDRTIAPLEAARNYFNQAARDSTHARALVGLGGVLYLEALGDPSGNTIKVGERRTDGKDIQAILDTLDSSEEKYIDALRVYNRGDTSETALIPLKVEFGLGKIELIRYFIADSLDPGTGEPHLRQAQVHFEEVTALGDRQNPAGNLVGHAYALLGTIYRTRGDIPKAIEQFDEAIDRVTPFYRIQYTLSKGKTYYCSGMIQESINEYQVALDEAAALGFLDLKETIQELLVAPEKTDCPN